MNVGDGVGRSSATPPLPRSVWVVLVLSLVGGLAGLARFRHADWGGLIGPGA